MQLLDEKYYLEKNMNGIINEPENKIIRLKSELKTVYNDVDSVDSKILNMKREKAKIDSKIAEKIKANKDLKERVQKMAANAVEDNERIKIIMINKENCDEEKEKLDLRVSETMHEVELATKEEKNLEIEAEKSQFETRELEKKLSDEK